MTVSVASVNIRPSTGIKLPVINFAVLSVIPSVTAPEALYGDDAEKHGEKYGKRADRDISEQIGKICVTLY